MVKRLMSMYPHHAADILKRSDDVPYRLRVSALMARTLLEALANGARHDKDNGARLGELASACGSCSPMRSLLPTLRSFTEAARAACRAPGPRRDPAALKAR